MNLKSMSIDKLTKLRDQVDTALHSRVADERRTLEAELTKLSRLSTSQLRSKGLGLGVRGPTRTLQHCTEGEAGDKEGAQEGPQSQKGMTGSQFS